jgi:hypothetical protein
VDVKEITGVDPASPDGDASCTVRAVVGARFICFLEDDDDWRIFGEYIVIVNPTLPPRMVHIETGRESIFPS